MSNTLKLGNGKWATGKDTLLAYNDLNSNYKPLAFSFSRASSGTVINKDGLIETVGSGEPRIDFKDNTKGALLLEPTRSNSLLQSNSLDQWSKSTSIEVIGSQVGVGGSDSAWLINRTDTNARYVQASSIVNGTQVLSFYVKANTTDWIWVFNGTNSCYLDISNGVQGTSVGFTDVTFELMDNSWYRVSLKSDNATTYTRIYPANANNSVTGLLVDLSFYIQYAQLEQGSYATSYIPTNGSAVTRVADSNVSLHNLSIFDYTSQDFSISFKIKAKSFDNTFNRIISKASTTSGYEVFVQNNGTIYFRTVSSGVGVFSYTQPNQIVSGVESNITITRIGALGKIYKDGIEITSGYANHSNISSSASNELRLGSYVLAGYDFSGIIKDVRLYDTALTDQELIALTTI